MGRHGEGHEHIDSGKTFEHPDYPNTLSFASSPSENRSKVTVGAKSRGPGGSHRGKGPWKTHCNSPSVNESIKNEDGDPS